MIRPLLPESKPSHFDAWWKMTVACTEYREGEVTISSGVGHSTSPNLEYYNYCSST